MIFGVKFCKQCGHAFKRRTGKRVKIFIHSRYEIDIKVIYPWFCAEHKPAWDESSVSWNSWPPGANTKHYYYWRNGVSCTVTGELRTSDYVDALRHFGLYAQYLEEVDKDENAQE